jgi:cytochrome bd-type quinol oxidase subunit 1
MNDSPTKQPSTIEPVKNFVAKMGGNVSEGTHNLEIKPRETPEETTSRLKTTEGDATFKRRITYGVLCIAFLVLIACFWIIMDGTYSIGNQEKAWGAVAVILSALFGYVIGKAGK